jgi:hypothetical protein
MRADALTLIGQYFLDNHQSLGTSGGSRPHVSVTVDLDVLAGRVGGLGLPRLGSSGLDIESIRQLCCGGGVSRVVMSGGSWCSTLAARLVWFVRSFARR